MLLVANDCKNLILDLAPRVNQVSLLCPTDEQKREVEKAAAKAGFCNIVCDTGDPEFLPYDAGIFNLLVCYNWPTPGTTRKNGCVMQAAFSGLKA